MGYLFSVVISLYNYNFCGYEQAAHFSYLSNGRDRFLLTCSEHNRLLFRLPLSDAPHTYTERSSSSHEDAPRYFPYWQIIPSFPRKRNRWWWWLSFSNFPCTGFWRVLEKVKKGEFVRLDFGLVSRSLEILISYDIFFFKNRVTNYS